MWPVNPTRQPLSTIMSPRTYSSFTTSLGVTSTRSAPENRKQGLEFTARTAGATSIKYFLLNNMSTYVLFFEPFAFAVSLGHPLLKGLVNKFVSAKRKGYFSRDKDIQTTLLANKAVLGSIIATLLPDAEFSSSNEITFISALGDIDNAPLHKLALKNPH